jgi:hypothetical protein
MAGEPAILNNREILGSGYRLGYGYSEYLCRLE